jgi:hypothetical protein
MNIRQLIQEIALGVIRGEELYSVVGKVSEIDEAARTCTVTPIEGAPIFDVRLQAWIDNEKGFVHIPSDGSEVIVTFINKDTGFVASMSEVAKIVFILEDGERMEFQVDKSKISLVFKNSELEITPDKISVKSADIEFNDGTLGGLLKMQAAVNKWNATENKVNEILSILQGVVIPLAPSGTYPFAPLFGATTPLTPTAAADVENTKIKQ